MKNTNVAMSIDLNSMNSDIRALQTTNPVKFWAFVVLVRLVEKEAAARA